MRVAKDMVTQQFKVLTQLALGIEPTARIIKIDLSRSSSRAYSLARKSSNEDVLSNAGYACRNACSASRISTELK